MYYELEVKEEREMSSTYIFGDCREGENTSTWDLKTSAQIAGPRECFATALCWGGLEGPQVFWKFTNLQEQFLLENLSLGQAVFLPDSFKAGDQPPDSRPRAS